MKNIPHDYYHRFIDASVYSEVLDYHSKANFTFHEAFKGKTSLHFLDEEQLAQLTGNELILYPDMDLTVALTLREKHKERWLYRNESCERFSSMPLNFTAVEELMLPLLSPRGDSYKRGYPSGGGTLPC